MCFSYVFYVKHALYLAVLDTRQGIFATAWTYSNIPSMDQYINPNVCLKAQSTSFLLPSASKDLNKVFVPLDFERKVFDKFTAADE